MCCQSGQQSAAVIIPSNPPLARNPTPVGEKSKSGGCEANMYGSQVRVRHQCLSSACGLPGSDSKGMQGSPARASSARPCVQYMGVPWGWCAGCRWQCLQVCLFCPLCCRSCSCGGGGGGGGVLLVAGRVEIDARFCTTRFWRKVDRPPIRDPGGERAERFQMKIRRPEQEAVSRTTSERK